MKQKTRQLKVLELFSGTRSIGKAFEEKGHEVFSVEWDRQHEADLYMDIEFITPFDIPFIPDVIWASPDCTTYSIASISHHRNFDRTGKTDYAKKSDRVNETLWSLIRYYTMRNPNLLFFVENPRGLYHKMLFPERFNIDYQVFTVTYCQYGDIRMKPTTILTNHPQPNFKPMCKNGDTCHESAPRGSKTGTQGLKKIDRSRIPNNLCQHIVEISENLFKEN